MYLLAEVRKRDIGGWGKVRKRKRKRATRSVIFHVNTREERETIAG